MTVISHQKPVEKPLNSCIIENEHRKEYARIMDEDRLIRLAAGGDAAAFNVLLGNHEKRMYAVCLRICGNQEDAQDCLQESMLRVFRSISGFKGQSSFSTWVYRVTMNTCLDELRKRKNKGSTSLDGLQDAGWAPTDERDTPEHYTIREERKREIQKCISELPEDMRTAIVLRDIQGFSYNDISEIMNANVGTIKSRISRGREKLREKLLARAELFDSWNV